MTNLTHFPTKQPEAKPEPEELVWVCNCGCSTYFVGYREDIGHYIQCANCNSEIGDEGYNNAVLKLPDVPKDKPTQTDAGSVIVRALGGSEIARRTTLKKIGAESEADNLAAVFAYYSDSEHHSSQWTNCVDDATMQSIIRRMTATLEYLKRTYS